MPQVFDRSTGQPVNLPPDQAAAGLANGSLALDAKAGPIGLVDAAGKLHSTDPSQVAGLLGGGKYRLPNAEEELRHEAIQAERAKGLPGSLESAAQSGFNQLLLGAPEALTEHTETPEEKIQREAAEKYHSGARIFGGALGVAGSLLAGGEVFKGIEAAGDVAAHGILPAEEVAKAGLARRLTATAANYATQGALLSSPQAIVHAAFGDTKRAAETLGWGIGAGAALGGVSELLGTAAKGAAGGVGSLLEGKSEELNEFANRTGLQQAGAQKAQLNKLSSEQISDLGEFAHERGLIQPGMSREDIGEAIAREHAATGDRIGSAITKLDEAVTGARGDAQGRVLGAALKPGQLGQKLDAALITPEMRMPMNEAELRATQLVIDSANQLPTKIVNGQEVVSFEDAQNFVSSLRKKWANSVNKVQSEGGARGLETVTPIDAAKAAAYQVARDAVHQAADEVAGASGMTDLVGELAGAKRDYARLSKLEQFAANYERAQGGNKPIGLTDTIALADNPFASASAAFGGGAGALLGGVPGAVVGSQVGKLSGQVLGVIAKRWVEDKGMTTLSWAAKRAAKEGPDVFAAVMASDGAKRLAASMDQVTAVVRRMATSGLARTAPMDASEHLTHLLGSGNDGADGHDKLAARVTELAADPAALAQATSAVTGPWRDAAPEVADATQQQLAKTIQYLATAAPKAPAPAAPFAPQYWSPTAKERRDFHDRAEVAANPMRVMHHVERGTLTDAHLDAAEQLYPTVLGDMRGKVLQFAAEHPTAKMPAPERASISKLLGYPLDPIAQHGADIDAVYAGQTPPAPAPASPKAPSRKTPKLGKLPSLGTSMQTALSGDAA